MSAAKPRGHPDNRYSRAHQCSFDCGMRVPASSSPNVVPLPLSDPNAAIDPEEAFVAALASCPMLWLLSIAAKRGFVIERYEDDAVCELSKSDDGRLAMATIVLRPAVTFGEGHRPARAELDVLHEAHDACYLSNSVRTEIQVAPVWRDD